VKFNGFLSLVAGLLPVAALSWTAEAQSQRLSAQEAGVPPMEVIALVGEATATTDEGEQRALSPQSELELGQRIETGEQGRVAIAVRRSAAVDETDADIVLLGSETAVVLTAQREARTAPPVVVTIEQGIVRAVNRHVSGRPAIAILTGDRLLQLDRADLFVTYEPETDDARYLVWAGEVHFELGERTIRIIEQRMRPIEQGKVRGAKRLTELRWQKAIESTKIPDVDVEQPEPQRTASGQDERARNLGNRRPTASGESPPKPRPAPGASATASQRPDDAGKGSAEELEYVRLTTSKGDIVLELNQTRAPITVENFLNYVEKGFYEGTIFHRVVRSSIHIIQGGGRTADLQRKETDPPIKNEWQNGLKHERGTIAMARTSQPDSATSQFYINVKANPMLDRPRGGAAYCVFGRVVDGMDVVEEIYNTDTTLRQRMRDVPIETILIEQAEQISREEALPEKPKTPKTAPGPSR
jgi:cyclophilin family peptidyl-prolyl cis-trans isomerase